MHVQPISTFRLFQEGHLLRNSIAIFVLTTLFYFIGAELRLVHELSLFWPLNGVMAGVFARYVWLNRLHYYAISYVAMLVYDAITTEWGLVSLAINFSNMMFIVTVALLVARDKRLGKNKYEPVSALRLFNYCLLAALLCAIVGAIGSVSIDSLDFWPLLADWFSEQFSTGVLIVPCMLTLAIPGVLPIVKTLNRRDFPGAQYPERIIQFGEGNFLRAFVDWQIDLLNEYTDLNSGVVVVRPIETSFPPSLSTQDGLYTTIIRGLNEKGEAVSDARLIRSVNREISVYSEYDEFLKLAHNPEMRFVFSNTTEAGISYHAGDKFDDAPAVSYPAKLTRLLFERFSHFNGALDKGWIIIPCELIDYNGDALRELVLRYAQEWALPEAFIQWLDQANSFCSTLVDRIVTGYPRDEVAKLEEELGYHDGFLDTAEHFYLFVIQGPKSLATELRLDKYPLNVLIVDDIKPYKERKVAILNGAHTALVPVAFQAGLDTVGEAMNDAEICAFVEKAIYEEIIPVLDLPRDELESFASAVTGRFRNPYIKHQLLSIALNGMTKFRTRILPQLLAGQKANGTLPARLTFALAALIAFYRGERNGETYPVQDDAHWLERYQQLWSQYRDRVIGTQELVAIVLAEKDHWEQDLTQVPGLVEQVANDLDAILEKGMREAVRSLC